MQLEPNRAEDFVEYLVGADRLDEAAGELAHIVNDEYYSSPSGKTRHQLWLQLCELIAHNPDRITALPVEHVSVYCVVAGVSDGWSRSFQVIRQGIDKFLEMTGRLWTALADFYIRRAHFEKACWCCCCRRLRLSA
jgi:pre-mRNA-splicing factor SYF1